MEAEEVKALLEENIPGSEVIVEGEGCDFRLTVISDQFEGVMPVKRQQMIYSHLNEYITSGAIHAVTLSALTLSEKALSEKALSEKALSKKARQLDNQG